MQWHESRENQNTCRTAQQCRPPLSQAMESRDVPPCKSRLLQSAGRDSAHDVCSMLHESEASATLSISVWTCRPGAFLNQGEELKTGSREV